MNRGCLRFLAGNKNAGFWREKKRRNSQNFSAKMPEKFLHFSHFFALKGNTVHNHFVLPMSRFIDLTFRLPNWEASLEQISTVLPLQLQKDICEKITAEDRHSNADNKKHMNITKFLLLYRIPKKIK